MTTGPLLQPRVLRSLDLQPAEDAPSHLYAASGLVVAGEWLHVVADDELHVASFAARGSEPGVLTKVFAGELPEGAAARKAAKPDLEILMRVPAAAGSHGALLALGSGSRPQRNRGALLCLDDGGAIVGEPLPVDATPLYDRLRRDCGRVNLEGGWVHGGQLYLLQRGNRAGGLNALIAVDHAEAAGALLQNGGMLEAVTSARVIPIDLGTLGGVRLGFTDGCALPDGRFLFSAAAEDTADAYLDGAFGGAVIGLATAAGGVLWQRGLASGGKVEGIHAYPEDDSLRVLCVTDADDRAVPAQLLEVIIAR